MILSFTGFNFPNTMNLSYRISPNPAGQGFIEPAEMRTGVVDWGSSLLNDAGLCTSELK
jgi:hypothetical protein